MTETKTKWTPGAERAYQRLVHLFPESSLRNYPEDVKGIIDRETAAPEMVEALRKLLDMVTDNRTHGPEIYAASDVLHRIEGAE